MASPASVRSRTAASISPGDRPGGSTSRVTCVRSRASVGWSHSWVTPTTWSPRPRAKSSSVAWGTRETIRMGEQRTEWAQEGEELVRDLKFEDFAQAMAFVNRVAELAEEANHHPDILVHGWNKVRLTLSTHSAGNTLTEADHALARRIDALS